MSSSNNSPDIRILVGVKGTGLSDGSGKIILDGLKAIAQKIDNSDFPKVIFKLNEAKTKSKIQSQLNAIAKGIKLEIGGSETGQSTNKAQKQSRSDVFNEKVITAKKNLELLEYKYGNFKTNPKLVNEFNTLLESSKDLASSKDLTLFNQQVRQFTIDTRVAGKASKSFGTQIEELAAKFTAAISAITIFTLLRRYISEMIDNVRMVDSSLTELRKVTDGTEVVYDRFLDNASEKAKELNSTLTDVIDSTANFARLGHDIPLASSLAEAAIIYNNVGDEVKSIDDASQSIISTMQAFSIETSNAMSVVDKFNAVGNSFAISSGGIGEALQRSASSLAAANNTLSESIALIATANTVVQNPEVVGTALKTSSMRIRSAVSELEAAGEEIDEYAKSSSKLREEIKYLSGVDVMADESTFKSTYQILQEISRVWDSLEDIDRANISEILFGKRAGNVGMAILDNFDIAEKALDVAESSAGSAMKEYEKWTESIDAKIQRLSTSWQILSNTFINSDLIKSGTELLTGFLDVLTSIVDTFGGMPTLLGVLGGILGANNSGVIVRGVTGGLGLNRFALTKQDINIISAYNEQVKLNDIATAKFGESSIDLVAALKKVPPALQSIAVKADGTQKFIDNLNSSSLTLKGTLSSIGVSLLNAGIAMAASFIITEIVKAISDWINRVEVAREKAENLISDYQEAASKIEEIEQRIADIGTKIKEINSQPLTLASATELTNLRLETAELERQLAIEKELAKSKNAEAYTALLDAYDVANEKNQRIKTGTKSGLVAIGHGTFGYAPMDIYESFGNYEDRTQYLVDNYAGQAEWRDMLLDDLAFYEDFITQAEALGLRGESVWYEMRDAIANAIGIVNYDGGARFANDFSKNINRGGSNPFAGVDESDIIEGTTQWQILTDYANAYALTIDVVKQKLIELGYLQDSDGSVLSNSSMEAAASAVSAIEKVGAIIDKSVTDIEGNNVDFDKILDEFPNLVDEIDEYSKGQIDATELQREFNDALDDLNAEQAADEFDSLIEAYGSYGDGSSQVEESLESLESLIPGITAALYDENGALRAGASEAFSSRDALEQFIGAVIQAQLTQAQSNYITLQEQLRGVSNEARTAAYELYSFWMNAQGNFESYMQHRPSPSASSGGGGGSKSIYSEEYEAAATLADHYIELSELTQKRMKEGSDEWLAEQEKQYEYTKEKAELIKEELERLAAAGYDETSEEFAKLRREYEKAQNSLYDIAKSIWEAQRDAQIDALESQKDHIQSLMDAEEERWKKREEQLDYEISKQEALLSALKTYHGLQKTFSSERSELEGQLKIAKANATLYEGTSIADSAFSDEDYKKLTSRLDSISKEADALYNDVLLQINSVTKDNVEELSIITSAFERQYDLKLKEYEVAKQELAVARARKELENVQNERNVAMLVNGMWTWVADPEAVQAAIENVNEAEAHSIDAITELANAQREAILADALDSLEKQKILEEAQHEKIMEKYEEMLEELDQQIELLEEMEFVFEDFIKTLEAGGEGIAGAADGVVSALNGAASSISSAASSISSAAASISSAASSAAQASKVSTDASTSAKSPSKVIVPESTKFSGDFANYRYAEGGVAKHTGLAYMDGTPANPEIVFNSNDAAKLYNLVHNTPDLVSKMFKSILPTIVSAPNVPKAAGMAKSLGSNSKTVYVGEVKLSQQDSSTIINIMERVIPSFA